MDEIICYLYNYKLEELEERGIPEDFADYLPQDAPAQNLYKLYTQDMGKTPLEAAGLVLEAYDKSSVNGKEE